VAKFDMRAYARQGAQARAAELEAELASIYRAFPDLRTAQRTSGRSNSMPGAKSVRRRRTPMSAAQRKAVSARMKKYWAARRKAAH
jgi:hypothetical protein